MKEVKGTRPLILRVVSPSVPHIRYGGGGLNGLIGRPKASGWHEPLICNPAKASPCWPIARPGLGSTQIVHANGQRLGGV